MASLGRVRKALLHDLHEGVPVVVWLQDRRSPRVDRVSALVSWLSSSTWYLGVLAGVFWIVNENLARHLVTLWGTGYVMLHALKDHLLLPTPYQVSSLVANVHHAPSQFGFPSAQAYSSAMLAACVTGFRHKMTDQWSTTAVTIFVLWWQLVSVNRLYTGACTLSGVAAGTLLAAVPLWIWSLIRVDLMEFEGWGWGMCLGAILVLFAYPVPFRSTPSFPAAARVLGAVSGIWFGANPDQSNNAVAAYATRLCLDVNPWITACLQGFIGIACVVGCYFVLMSVLRPMIPTLKWLQPSFASHMLPWLPVLALYDTEVLKHLPQAVRRLVVIGYANPETNAAGSAAAAAAAPDGGAGGETAWGPGLRSVASWAGVLPAPAPDTRNTVPLAFCVFHCLGFVTAAVVPVLLRMCGLYCHLLNGNMWLQ